MVTRRNSRLSPEFALLGFLYRTPSYGYELHQRLEQQFGSIWHASQSQTYNILKRLETQGYLRSTAIDQEKLPPRQLLQLTYLGTERFEKWLDQPTNPSVHAIRVEFITRLFFTSMYYPERTKQMILAQIDVVDKGQAELRKQLVEMSPTKTFNRLGVELRFKLLSSVQSWLEDCLSEFNSEHTDGLYK